MNKLIATGVVAVLCHVGTASAAPAWCKQLPTSVDYNLRDLSADEPVTVLITLAFATCRPTPEASAAAAQIEASRQAWGKKFSMSDADWADVVALSQTERGSSGRPLKLPVLSVKDYTKATPLDQYSVIYQKLDSARGLGLDFAGGDYAADMFEPGLSETGRFAVVDACLDFNPNATNAPAFFAMCQADLDTFDRTKFLTELRTDTAHAADGAWRQYLRLRLATVAKRMTAHAEQVKKILAKDEQYKKLWDGAAKGRAAYAAVNIDKSLAALAARLDTAVVFQSRKMFEGCEAETEAAVDKIIREKVSASAFKDFPRDQPAGKFDYESPNRIATPTFGTAAGPILADIPELMYAMNPYIMCHKPDDQMSDFLKGLLAYRPQLRGPRRAALAGMLREKIVLDDLNAKVEYPYSEQPYPTSNPTTSTAGGVVSTVKDDEEDKNYVLVEFAKVMEKGEDCIQSHYTNRVTRVNSDGSLSYEFICDKWGPVTYDVTPAGMRILKKYKPLLKKGVQFAQYGGLLVAAWPSKTAKVPSHILGVEVK